uniref:Uncharacterized protein n=1 Tax=Rhodnius prolixus TaxID=13249 RepID=T1I3F6_RHOPR
MSEELKEEWNSSSNVVDRSCNEECSDTESNAISSELSSEDETVYIQSEASETEGEESTTNDENENVINMPSKRCSMRIISDTDEETENTFQEIERAADYHLILLSADTVWSQFEEGGIPGRLPSTCIFKDVCAFTAILLSPYPVHSVSSISEMVSLSSSNSIPVSSSSSELGICSNWAQPTDRQAKTLDSHALLVAALMVAKSRSKQ